MSVGKTVVSTELPDRMPRRGKVRDVYDFGDRLLLVATDRISAYDYILPTPIPDKGALLTQLSVDWFGRLGVRHHLLSLDPATLPLPESTCLDQFVGRSAVVLKTDVIPIECVVRGYLAGSAWAEYRQSGAVCGIALPPGLRESDALPSPIFTPATKAESGHDENISFDEMVRRVGAERAEELRSLSVAIYTQGAAHAAQCGLILADTKFEFGRRDDKTWLIDEVLTPDSSRFWAASTYRPGSAPPSFDKQFVRDWLTQSGWDRNSPPPELPPDVVEKTRAKYVEAFERLTGRRFGE